MQKGRKMKIELTRKELEDIKRAFDLLIEREEDQIYYSAYWKVLGCLSIKE